MKRFMFRYKRGGSRRGLAAVETALVMPLLLLVTFALIEYGWMFMKAQQVTGATRNGARMAITPDATSGDVNSLIADQLATAGMGGSSYSVTLSSIDVASGEQISVAVSVPYENVSILGMPFIPKPSTLGARATMAKEGP